jgi:hypothetical protein
MQLRVTPLEREYKEKIRENDYNQQKESRMKAQEIQSQQLSLRQLYD